MKQRFEDTNPDVIRDLLLLVGIDLPETTIAAWTPQQRYTAERYAARAYLRASDNPVRVPLEPEFITLARQAQPESGAGAAAWARAWKNGAKYYRGLFHDAVGRGARCDMAIEELIDDIESWKIGPTRLSVLDRLYEIRKEFQKL